MGSKIKHRQKTENKVPRDYGSDSKDMNERKRAAPSMDKHAKRVNNSKNKPWNHDWND